MRIGSIDYSSKATKLISALMVCVLIFTFVVPAQEADAAAGVALAAGLTLAFVAACGVAFTVNEAQNSQSYWEGQIDSYLDDSSLSDVGEWVDFGSVVYDSASGKLRYPGAVLSGLLDFFSWFTGKNSIEAGGRGTISSYSYGSLLDSNSGSYYNLGYCVSISSSNSVSSVSLGTILNSGQSPGFSASYTFSGKELTISNNGYYISGSFDGKAFTLTSTYVRDYCLAVCYGYSPTSSTSINAFGILYETTDSTYRFSRLGNGSISDLTVSTGYNIDYTTAAEGTLGLPDLEEKETELGYVPDINIPLPETVAQDTNIGDINDAADAVLDYTGTAGNTLDLEYEYVEETNVDTGTDTETGEGTGTDAETGTQTGSVALENVAADSLVEVAPETMLNDDTFMGLFISKFPWCIPFDLYFAISAFAADPVAPEFEVNLFEGVSWEGLDLSGTEMTLSFEAFEKVAAVTRWSTLIVFCAGLAMITKRMIWS